MCILITSMQPIRAQNNLLGAILLHATPERPWIFSAEFIMGGDSVRECPTGGEIVKHARISTSEENVRYNWTTDITLTAVYTPTLSLHTCMLFTSGGCLRTTKTYNYEASIVIIII